MTNLKSYRLLKMGLTLGLGLAAIASTASAQQSPVGPTANDVYCSGIATDEAIPADSYVISGENSSYRSTYSQGEHVYINKGADQGVKVGDRFEVSRAIHERLKAKWFKIQPELARAMGTMHADIGRLRVIHVLAKTSIAEVEFFCDGVQRGDLIRPFVERPTPAYHDVKFDPFAPPSGKKTAMVVLTKSFGAASGAGTTVYVNLGSAQGAHVGDYFRVFRYQGSHNDTTYQPAYTAYKMYGYGSTPVAYEWDNLPRQVLGEGIVVRTGPNSSAVLLTTASQEIYTGDYVEIE
jgi:hypothetical protein